METHSEVSITIPTVTRDVQVKLGNVSRQAAAKAMRSGRIRGVKVAGRWVCDPDSVAAAAGLKLVHRVLGAR